jgi:hypothetical protein
MASLSELEVRDIINAKELAGNKNPFDIANHNLAPKAESV